MSIIIAKSGVAIWYIKIFMKKLLFVLFVLVVSENAFAQKGMMGVGGNVAMCWCFHDSGIGIGGTVKYQYYLSDYFRIEPSITYFMPLDKKDGTFNLAPMVNIHAFILPPGSVRPYGFLGIGYLGYKRESEYTIYHDVYDSDYNWTGYNESRWTENESDNGLGLDGGVGLDCRLTHSLSLQVEVGILLGIADDDTNGLKASIGLCYNF